MVLAMTRMSRERWDVDRRIAQLGPHREGLLDAVRRAVAAAAEATEFHPANAAGTLAYMTGTWALRNAFVGKDWMLDRCGGVESIRKGEARIVYTNVDVACDEAQAPKPLSHKGAGSKDICSGNLLFPPAALPMVVPPHDANQATWFLMVDREGRAELSQPVIENGGFGAFVERLWLNTQPMDEAPALDDADATDFDPPVARKSSAP